MINRKRKNNMKINKKGIIKNILLVIGIILLVGVILFFIIYFGTGI